MIGSDVAICSFLDHGRPKVDGGMAKMATNDDKLIEMVREAGFSFGPAIVAESKREGVPFALALALVEDESGFKNIFGCDLGPQSTAPWCHQDVTRDRSYSA